LRGGFFSQKITIAIQYSEPLSMGKEEHEKLKKKLKILRKG
jgi:hypothetical protein